MQRTPCKMLGWMKSQAEIKTTERNINNLRYADDTTLMAENEEELKSLWWGWKRRVKSWLETQHSKNWDHGTWSHHCIANRRGKTEAEDFIFLGSKNTANGDCSHETERHVLLGRKAMTNLDSILKSRDNTLLTKVHIAKAMVFPAVMYTCESWTIKTEHWRTNAFEL